MLFVCSQWTVSAEGAIEPRSTLYTFFETGDIPTEEQFTDFIDSFLTISGGNPALVFDSSASLNSHTVRSPTGGVTSIMGNQGWDIGHIQDPVVDENTSFSPTIGLGDGSGWPGARGYLGFSIEAQEPGQAPTTHYGFLQISVDGPSTPDPYAIRIVGAAIETTPGAPISVFQIPEPSAAALMLVLAGYFGLGIRSRRASR